MNAYLEKLREGGLKVTARRRAIIELFLNRNAALSPQDVQSSLKTRFSQCGLPGVYRNLDAMAACGILFRIVSFGSERRYALCREADRTKHHHHIICVSCGKVGNVTECAFHDGMTVNGFELLNHVVQLNGLCASCAETMRVDQ